MRAIYIAGGAVTLVLGGALHVYSYSRAVPEWGVMALLGCGVLMFALLLFACWRVAGGRGFAEAWVRELPKLMSAGPTWVRVLGGLAWIGGIVALARTMLGGAMQPAGFVTAWSAGAGSMVLSFGLGASSTGKEMRNQVIDPTSPSATAPAGQEPRH